jgi:hypothetical protein
MSKIEIGDSVKITGDIKTTSNIVHVTRAMKEIINNEKTYIVQGSKNGGIRGAHIIKAGGWWWAPENLEKVFKGPIRMKNLKPSLFEVDLLDV